MPIFYCYGAVAGYHTKEEAVKKAAIFAVITLAIYIIPQAFIGIEATLVIAVVGWALLWSIVIYRQATSPCFKTIR